MKNIEQSNWWEHNHFINGYGKFPYVILKVGCALYMQIPIHFNKDGDFVNYPGTHVNGISEIDLSTYNHDKLCSLHEKIIEHCQWMKNKIETDRNRTIKMCLVEGPDISYYFEGDTIEFSTSIPSGGNLITQDYKVIGMNVKHYL
ncbi:hypothetical protein [Flavobacterium aciduliphilum]|uniref:Uncharacterized protein n=1 Tax=Flavobacterium aciduliphilum TaxID=1101402 RepID=A0A328YJI6_9FLAO|nr:hypothetical protein [Flavobacterium aciduliphilum]RAR73690.1 hypothetical protein CLV55_1039 [Flavobacterium aciduliphilum]